jgi:recombinational DNA repair protein RecR
VAIGVQAGQDSQSLSAVAIGSQAGESNQGQYAVAMGDLAGKSNQGIAAVAIGALAGETSQGNNSIIINATNVALDQTAANTFTVKPVRAVTNVTFVAPSSGSVPVGFSPMFYNPTTGEIIVITT